MIPAEFEYYAPTSLDEVFSLLARYGDGARLLAGGHSLLPLMKLRLAQPSALIDLARVPGLSGVREEAGTFVIGAMTTHHQVYSSTAVQRGARALSEAAGLIGDPLVRNRGTIGGSLCHADPGADLPAVMVALNAQIVAARQGGSRTIPAAEFFTDMYSTALQPGEVLTEVRVPVAAAGTGSAYVKFPSPASRYAVVGVAARVTVANGSVGSASVALTGAATRVARLSAVEQGVTGAVPSAETFQRAAARAAEGWEPLGDMHASGEYRQALAAVYAQKALTAAAARV